jgi:hypothetical protein
VEAYADMPIEEIETIIGVLDEDNVETKHAIPIETFLEDLEDFGVWGFCDEDRTLHMWFAKHVHYDNLIRFFAHEYAHITDEIDVPVEMADEYEAEFFGEGASFAYEMTHRLLGCMCKK